MPVDLISLTPQNIHLRPNGLFFDWHIFRVILSFVQCLPEGHHLQRYYLGAPNQFIASIGKQDKGNISVWGLVISITGHLLGLLQIG